MCVFYQYEAKQYSKAGRRKVYWAKHDLDDDESLQNIEGQRSKKQNGKTTGGEISACVHFCQTNKTNID